MKAYFLAITFFFFPFPHLTPSMGRNGPPPRVVCAPARMGKSDAALSHAHCCCVDTRSWSSSLQEAAAPSVWALGVSMGL